MKIINIGVKLRLLDVESPNFQGRWVGTYICVPRDPNFELSVLGDGGLNIKNIEKVDIGVKLRSLDVDSSNFQGSWVSTCSLKDVVDGKKKKKKKKT